MLRSIPTAVTSAAERFPVGRRLKAAAADPVEELVEGWGLEAVPGA